MNTTSSSDFGTRRVTTSSRSGQQQPWIDATERPGPHERALVLGGGGSTGNAWLIGVIAGLCHAGLDVTAADLTIGTSAGSTAAAQLAGATPGQLLAATLSPPAPAPAQSERGRAQHPPAGNHLDRTNAIIAAATGPADMRRRIGAAALELEAASDGSWQARWRETVARRLPSKQWPEDRLTLITAVHARSGEPVAFDRGSGVDLADAVAASCASGLPYWIGNSPYIDGGYRRNENADLAAGYRRVLVLSPFGGRTRMPMEWNMQLAAQVEELIAAGSSVHTIVPDRSCEFMFGANAMDLSLRPAAARAGRSQGEALASRLATLWG